jgi:hypothetical protein
MATLTACPKCRTVVPPGHATCLRCGHAVDTPVRACASCGHRNDADSRFCARCGHGLSDPVVPPPAAVPPTAFPTADAGPRPRAFLVTAAVLVALCVVVAGLKIVDHEYFSPGRTVSAFFDALASRDASAARGLLVSGYAGAPLLQNAVLKNDGYSPPTAVRVEDADITGGQASVRVSYALSDVRDHAEIVLNRDNQATAGVFHRWHIDGGVTELDVATTDAPAVSVAGALIPLAEDGESAGLAAFPGRYQVSLPDQALWTATPLTAVVGLGMTGEPVTLDPQIKDTARAVVDEQVRAYVDECAKSTQLNPPNCPFSAGTYDQVSNVHWKIATYPDFQLDRDFDNRLVVSTTTQGEADATGKAVPYFGGSSYSYSEKVSFDVSGAVTLSGAEVAFQPDQD